MPEITRPSVRIVAFGEDNDGELYFLDHDGGTLHTLERNDASAQNADFPTTLSQTGLFASVKDHTPAAGVIPFAVNSRQWQDGATAEHWVAFPGESSATLHATGKPIPGMVYWHNFRMHFPKDAVLVRTLSLARPAAGDAAPALRRHGLARLHVRLARRSDRRRPGPRRRRREGSARSASRSALWQFHSRSQCMSCHSNQSEYALAFLPEQLNRPGPDGRNQLVALTEAGFIRRVGNDGKPLPPFDAASAATRTKARRPGRREPAAGGAGPRLPARQLRPLPLRPRRRGGRRCGCSSPSRSPR